MKKWLGARNKFHYNDKWTYESYGFLRNGYGNLEWTIPGEDVFEAMVTTVNYGLSQNNKECVVHE